MVGRDGLENIFVSSFLLFGFFNCALPLKPLFFSFFGYFPFLKFCCQFFSLFPGLYCDWWVARPFPRASLPGRKFFFLLLFVFSFFFGNRNNSGGELLF